MCSSCLTTWEYSYGWHNTIWKTSDLCFLRHTISANPKKRSIGIKTDMGDTVSWLVVCLLKEKQSLTNMLNLLCVSSYIENSQLWEDPVGKSKQPGEIISNTQGCICTLFDIVENMLFLAQIPTKQSRQTIYFRNGVCNIYIHRFPVCRGQHS